jgi:hypothetical protein
VSATTADRLRQCADAASQLVDAIIPDGLIVPERDAHTAVLTTMSILQELWDTAYQAGRDDAS